MVKLITPTFFEFPCYRLGRNGIGKERTIGQYAFAKEEAEKEAKAKEAAFDVKNEEFPVCSLTAYNRRRSTCSTQTNSRYPFLKMEEPDELLRSALSGSEAALDTLLLQQYDALLDVARSRIPHQLQRIIDPEDVVNDVFIAAMKNVSTFDGKSISQFSAWLRTIARNQIIDVSRKKANADRESVFSLILDVTGARQHESPSKMVSREEAEEELRNQIARLPERQLQAIKLRCMQELTWDEVAERMNLSKAAVRSLVHRAKELLRDRMRDIGVSSDDQP